MAHPSTPLNVSVTSSSFSWDTSDEDWSQSQSKKTPSKGPKRSVGRPRKSNPPPTRVTPSRRAKIKASPSVEIPLTMKLKPSSPPTASVTPPDPPKMLPLDLTRPKFRVQSGKRPSPPLVETDLARGLSLVRPTFYEKHPELASKVQMAFREKLARVDRVTMSYMSDKFRSFDRTSFQTGVLTHEAVQEADLPIPKEKYTPKLSVEQKMFKLLDVLQRLPEAPPPLSGYPNCGLGRKNRFVPAELLESQVRSQCMPDILDPDPSATPTGLSDGPLPAQSSPNEQSQELSADCSLFEAELEHPLNNNNLDMPKKRTPAKSTTTSNHGTPKGGSSESLVGSRELKVVVHREEVERYRAELDRSPRGSLSLNLSKDDEDPIQSSSLNQGNQDCLDLTVPKLFESPKVTSTPKSADEISGVMKGPSQNMDTIVSLTRKPSSCCSSSSSSSSSSSKKCKEGREHSLSKSSKSISREDKSTKSTFKPLKSPKSCGDSLKPALMKDKAPVNPQSKSSYKIPKKTITPKSTTETTSSSTIGNSKANKKSGGRLFDSPFLASLFESSPQKAKSKLNRSSSSQNRRPIAAKPTEKPVPSKSESPPTPINDSPTQSVNERESSPPSQETQEECNKPTTQEGPPKTMEEGSDQSGVKRKRLSLKDYQSKKAKASEKITEPNPALEEGEMPDSDDEISIVGLVMNNSPKAIVKPRKPIVVSTVESSSSREPSISPSTASSSDKLLIDEDKTQTATPSPIPIEAEQLPKDDDEMAHPLRTSPLIDRGPRRKKEVNSSQGMSIAKNLLLKENEQQGDKVEEDDDDDEAVQLELDSEDRLDLDESGLENEEVIPAAVPSTSKATINEPSSSVISPLESTPNKENSQEFIDAMPPSLKDPFMALYSKRLCFKQLEFGVCQKRLDFEAYMRNKRFPSQVLGVTTPPRLRCSLNHEITYNDFKTFLLLISESSEDQLPLMLRPRTHNRFARIMGMFNANKHWIGVHFILEIMAIVIRSAKLAAEPSFEFCIVIETIVNDLDHFQKIFEFPDQHPPQVLAGFKVSIEQLFNQTLDLVSTLVLFSEHHRGSNEVLKLGTTLDKVFALSSFWGLVLSPQSFKAIFQFFGKYEKAFQKPLNVLYHFAFMPGFEVESRDLDLFLRKFVNDLDLTALKFALVPIVLALPASQFRELFTQFPSVKSLLRRTVELNHQVPCAAIFDRIRAEQLTDLIPCIPDVEEFIDTSALDELSALMDDPTRRFQLLNVLDQRLLSPFKLREFFLDLVKLFCEKEDPKEIDGIFSDFAEMFFKNPFRPPIALHFLAQLRNTLVIHIYTMLKDLPPEDRCRSLEHLYMISSMSPERLMIPDFPIWSIPSLYDPSALGFECLLQPSTPFGTVRAAVMLLVWKRCDLLAMTIFHQDASEIVLKAPRHERVDLASAILRLKMNMYRADGGLALKNGVLEGVLVLFRDHIAPFMSEKRVNTIQCVEDSNNFLTFWLSHCQLKANRDSLQANILPLCRQYRTKLTLWEATMRSLVHTLELQGFPEEADQFYSRARDLNYYVNQSSLDNCFAFPYNISPHELTVILRCYFKCLLEENLIYDPRVLEDLLQPNSCPDWARYRIAITYVPSGCSTTGLAFLDIHAAATPEMGRRRLRQALKSLKPPIVTDQNGESFNPESLIHHLVRMSQP